MRADPPQDHCAAAPPGPSRVRAVPSTTVRGPRRFAPSTDRAFSLYRTLPRTAHSQRWPRVEASLAACLAPPGAPCPLHLPRREYYVTVPSVPSRQSDRPRLGCPLHPITPGWRFGSGMKSPGNPALYEPDRYETSRVTRRASRDPAHPGPSNLDSRCSIGRLSGLTAALGDPRMARPAFTACGCVCGSPSAACVGVASERAGCGSGRAWQGRYGPRLPIPRRGGAARSGGWRAGSSPPGRP